MVLSLQFSKQNIVTNAFMVVLSVMSAGVSVSASAVLNRIDANTVVEKAIDNHPLVQSARSEARATDEGVTAARLGRFPSLTVDSGLGTNGPTATVDLQQPIWSAGRIDSSIDQATYDTYAARASVEEQRYEIGKRALEAWQAFVSSANLKYVYKNNLRELDRFQSMMRRRVSAQVSARIELDLVMNRILQSQDAYDGAVEQQRIALSRLEQIIGEPISKAALTQTYNLEAMAARVRRESGRFDQSIIYRASHTHPSVVRSAYQARSAQSAADIEKSATLPQVVARYQHQYVRDTDSKSDQLTVGLQYAPGAGFSSYALAKAAQERVNSIKQTQEAARRQVVEDLQVDYQQFASARDRERALMAAVDGARIVKESYERQFIAGRKSWLDVLNAVREEESYAAQLVQARVNFIAAYYRLKLGVGLLPWQRQTFGGQQIDSSKPAQKPVRKAVRQTPAKQINPLAVANTKVTGRSAIKQDMSHVSTTVKDSVENKRNIIKPEKALKKVSVSQMLHDPMVQTMPVSVATESNMSRQVASDKSSNKDKPIDSSRLRDLNERVVRQQMSMFR